MKDWSSELDKCTELIRKNPNDKELYRKRANLYNKLDKFELAMLDYDKILTIDKTDSEAYFKRACEWYNWKIFELDEMPKEKDIINNTIRYIDKAISLDATIGEYYYRKAEIYFHLLDQYELSLEMCKKAEICHLTNSNLYMLMGQVYNELDKYEEALKCYDKGLEINEDADLYYFKGVVYYNKAVSEEGRRASKYYKLCEDCYKNAIKIESNNERYYIELAELYAEVYENPKKAIEWYKKSLNVYENEEIYIKIAQLYREIEEFKLVEKFYMKALKLKPNSTEANFGMAEYYFEQEEYNKSLRYTEHLIKNGIVDEDVFLLRGECYMLLKEYESSINTYNEILDIKESDILYFNRGNVYLEMSSYTQAIEDYTKAIEISGGFLEGYRRRAIAYARSGNLHNALEDIEKALEIDSEDEDVINTMEEIKKDSI